MTDPLVIREDRDAITHLTLNSPGNLNALSDEMLAALQKALDTLSKDTSQKVIVLKGAGRVFCAGHDLKQMQAARQAEDRGAAAWKDLFDRCSHLMQTLPRLPQPVIAQVHGLAAAAGCQLVASCDLAVATDDARFGVNGVNIGLFCSTPMVALSRVMPRKQVFEMLTTGEFLDAARAREVGLINRIAAPDALDATTQELAETIAAKLSSAVKVGKQAFYAQADLTLADAYALTGDVMVENMLNAQTNEGITAFLEKRKPDWATS
ncbi:enoyl-CoA hydratase [Rhodobacteraceae bacterium N5(2021)]|uniref:Enoyl-CoA hydratase domain-containing protein 3, mitochondrial n=1 Tax=Gymnodinialimonas phycosphaerae TaxID=2841589 RepID=A0A975YH49_9RHOB|nr:enoyl-CoA hydratase [Gymnodinialimonas phycosphaerae]MBY4892280.1 enoyl-CoA hydratase [Gymnodinialimonas phycosphaerae]